MNCVLIVEDEKPIANLIQMSLKSEGYSCCCAFDGEQAAQYIEEEGNSYDLILLDVMLPKVNGYELMEYIRPLNIPVIFITAKSNVQDRIKGLKLGADDYIVKPFQIGELLARVEAVLRRLGKSEGIYEVFDVVVNTESREVLKNGKPVRLTIKEFDLLVQLILNKNVVLRRSRLYELVWQEEFLGDTRTLDTHIQRLRRKLGWEDHIKTVFHMGYKLEV